MTKSADYGWFHRLMREATIDVLAHAKLMHMSIAEKEQFSKGFSYCSDRNCIWCHGPAQDRAKEPLRGQHD